MIDFLFGAFAGAFIILAILQIATKKTINLVEITDKSADPDRHRNFIFAYFLGALGVFLLFLIYDKM